MTHPSAGARDANPLRAAFDFGFTSYATPGLVKIIYLLAVVLALLGWIGGTILVFVAAAAPDPVALGPGESPPADSGPDTAEVAAGVVTLVLGWIPGLLWVLLVRIVLEAAIALTRIAEDTQRLRRRSESGPAQQ